MKPFPHEHVNRGPRCPMCLQNTPRREYIPRDGCDAGCLEVDYGMTRSFSDKPPKYGHLHFISDCGFKWATTTAEEAGHDPAQQ